MFDFLRILVAFFEKNDISYMLSGSVAMSLYVEPRFTRDYDFIVHLRPENIQQLTDTFANGYYCDEDAVKDAVKHKGMFNIIDHKSGYKADFVILKNEPFRLTEFERRCKMKLLDMDIYVVSPEDLLLSKIAWIQDLQSGVQMEDIKLLSKMDDLDWVYIRHWIETMNLKTFNLLFE
jgi:hypothetical protein